MCGITGFIGKNPRLTEDMLLRMRETLAHRGPDDAGSFFREYAAADGAPTRVGLAHRRLSIIDLSEQGRQPMSNEDESVLLSYNGEFYNFADYRSELEGKGHRFISRTDTETIIHLHEQYGLETTLERMNGMFAFALWDERKRRLFLTRDRMGQKPLYYVELKDGFIFASEIKALLASGLIDETALDVEAMDQYWQLGYIMAPRTVYSNIRQLPPAFYSVISDDGIVEDSRRYWRIDYDYNAHPYANLNTAVNDLEERLASSVEQRLISDVPLGLFLSGGIDSTLIAAVASRVLGKELNSFTIGFPSASSDETEAAGATAAALGHAHTVMPVDEVDLSEVDKIVAHFDEPFGDMSCIPTYYVSKLTRRHVTVALSGDAGDELFGGYEHYRQGLAIWSRRVGISALLRDAVPNGRNLRFATGYGPEGSGYTLRYEMRDQKNFVANFVASFVDALYSHPASGIRNPASHWYYSMLGPTRGFARKERLINNRLRGKLYDREMLGISSRQTMKAREQWAKDADPGHPLDIMQTMDRHTYLPDDVLTKVDRMSMAVSLECRSPLLDHRVVECAMRLPPAWRISHGGETKFMLKKLLERYLPREQWDRPKQGFTPPWEQWCGKERRAQLREQWRDLANDYFRKDVADWLFPDECTREKAPLMWAAYSMLRFLEGQK